MLFRSEWVVGLVDSKKSDVDALETLLLKSNKVHKEVLSGNMDSSGAYTSTSSFSITELFSGRCEEIVNAN